jgi:hypothetical protein
MIPQNRCNIPGGLCVWKAMQNSIWKRFALAILLASQLVSPILAAEPAPNTLTPEEKAAGWRLLFDGKTTTGWRGFKKATFPTNGWAVADGWLNKLAGQTGGDVITLEQFSDFELSWEWRIPAKANNGVKYMILEERGAIGHEYQMLDDRKPFARKQKTAAFYDVLPTTVKVTTKLDPEVNQSRVLVKGNHVEHWLNGDKVLEYELGSPAVLEAVAKSKFRNVKDFGCKVKGHILLTDHHDGASFRNVKIRELP